MPPMSKNPRARRESTNNNSNLYGMQSARQGGSTTPNMGRSASTKPVHSNEGYMQATKSWAKKNIEKKKEQEEKE